MQCMKTVKNGNKKYVTYVILLNAHWQFERLTLCVFLCRWYVWVCNNYVYLSGHASVVVWWLVNVWPLDGYVTGLMLFQYGTLSHIQLRHNTTQNGIAHYFDVCRKLNAWKTFENLFIITYARTFIQIRSFETFTKTIYSNRAYFIT